VLPGRHRSALAAAAPVTIPEEAEQPWPALPPRELCDAEPARWAELRAQRDPMPEVYEGTEGMASWHRALGWRVELELRKSGASCWTYDPALPLAAIMSGLPRWNRRGERRDTGEDAEDFARIVRDYERHLAAGSVFPPLLVTCYEPAADVAALGLWGYRRFCTWWSTGRNHYSVISGRHRAIAAWRTGLRTFPAFVVGPVRELAAANEAHGNTWAMPAADVAGERGRQGEELEVLQQLGKLKVVYSEPAP
jgi:hypothetical protein